MVYIDITNEQLIRVQRLHNSCVRYIFGVRRDAHITPYRKRLGWLRVSSRTQYHSALLMYKALRMHELSYIAAFFSQYHPRPTCRGVLPASHEIGCGCRVISSSRSDSLELPPPSLRYLPSYCKFRRAVRQYLFDLVS